MPNYKVLIVENNGVELEFQEELALSASNVSASTVNGLTSDSVQGQLDELAAAPGGAAAIQYTVGFASERTVNSKSI